MRNIFWSLTLRRFQNFYPIAIGFRFRNSRYRRKRAECSGFGRSNCTISSLNPAPLKDPPVKRTLIKINYEAQLLCELTDRHAFFLSKLSAKVCGTRTRGQTVSGDFTKKKDDFCCELCGGRSRSILNFTSSPSVFE